MHSICYGILMVVLVLCSTKLQPMIIPRYTLQRQQQQHLSTSHARIWRESSVCLLPSQWLQVRMWAASSATPMRS